MDIDQEILKKLKVASLRNPQKQVINAILGSDENLFAVMPTGSGKTLCFMYAALAFQPVTVIVYPLISLMNDQLKRFNRLNIPTAILRGGQTKTQRAKAFAEIRSGKVKAVITNPETLIQKNIAEFLKKTPISFLIIDEAHTVVEWGESFRNAMLEMINVIRLLNPKRVLAFTATATEDDKTKFLNLFSGFRGFNCIIFSANRPNIIYEKRITYSRISALLELLKSCQKPCIVFANNRNMIQSASILAGKTLPGLSAKCYHASLCKKTREEIENWFISSKDGVLFSTCAFGMGVDKGDIRTSIHLKLPDSASAFLQESGRIGRDGERAISYSIIKPSEAVLCKSERRKRLFGAFSQDECIRKALLEEMGEKEQTHKIPEDGCGACGACLKVSYADTLKKIVLEFLNATRHALDENETTLCLSGVRCKATRCAQLLPLFGTLAHLDRRIIFECVHETFLQKSLKKEQTKKLWTKFRRL